MVAGEERGGDWGRGRLLCVVHCIITSLEDNSYLCLVPIAWFRYGKAYPGFCGFKKKGTTFDASIIPHAPRRRVLLEDSFCHLFLFYF